MSQHTKTPWVARKIRTRIHIGRGEYSKIGEYSHVCEITVSAKHVYEDYPGRRRDFIARQEANAAFIVKAVNSHEVLVSALEHITGHFEEWARYHSDEMTCDIAAAIHNSRSLLATLTTEGNR